MSERIRLETWEYDSENDPDRQPFSDRLQELAQSDPRIAEYEHGGDSHWLHLNDGWTDGECHTIHEDTVERCLEQLAGVTKCDCCADCRAASK